jgi:hypothetical protein
MANRSKEQKNLELELRKEEEKINLAKMSLLLAKCVEYPNLIVDEYLLRMEKWQLKLSPE